MTKKYPLVLVEWDDAWSTSDKTQTDNRKLDEPMIRRSIGFEIRRRPRVIIAQTIDDKLGCEILSIPRSQVRKITRLKEDG